MKVKLDFNLNAWFDGIEIEADSLDKAKEILYSKTFEELVEEGYVKEFNIDDVGAVLLEEVVKVKVYDIEYSIEEDEFDSPEDYIQTINALPDSLVLSLVVGPSDPLEDLIADEITYETEWLVKNFNYMIIEKK